MNTKVIPAYELESTNTIKLSPIAIGELLYKCNADQLESAVCELVRLTKLHQSKARVNSCLTILRQGEYS